MACAADREDRLTQAAHQELARGVAATDWLPGLGAIVPYRAQCLGWRHAAVLLRCLFRQEEGALDVAHGAVADRRTQAKLGGDALSAVLAALWPGDCQSCGTSLGPGEPALTIDDLHVVTRATVHHRACQAPRWNDSQTLHTPASALLTWRTVVLLLPFQVGRRVIRAAGRRG